MSDFGIGLGTDSPEQFARFFGVARGHRIKIPKIKPIVTIWKDVLEEVPEVPKDDSYEDYFVSVSDFKCFILPKLSDYVKEKKQELEEKGIQFRKDIGKFLKKGKNLELIKDMISLAESGGVL